MANKNTLRLGKTVDQRTLNFALRRPRGPQDMLETVNLLRASLRYFGKLNRLFLPETHFKFQGFVDTPSKTPH